jgi:queuine tRNA-ribosyltransferase
VLTDSGGYQVFSLNPRVDDDGAVFRSTYDGSFHRLSPERAVVLQRALGADIQMVLDVCPGLPAPVEVVRDAVDRTADWAARARAAFEDPAAADPAHGRSLDQAQFGIVQGGVDQGLRRESAERTVALGFDGYAIGGLSVGEDRRDLLPALAAAMSQLPADQPRYLMGVGDPASLVDAIGLGVDLFDCVLPTRLARHGTILTDEGRLPIRNARYATDAGPIDDRCGCPTCGRWSRAYLRHLLQVGEPSVGRLLTLHNVWWTLNLVRRAGDAIRRQRFGSFRAEIMAVWA